VEADNIVDINSRRTPAAAPRRTMAGKKAVQDLLALQNGTAARSPVVLVCHIRGEGDAFPRRWHLGSVTLGQGQPVWRPLGLRRRRPPITFPSGTFATGEVRAVMREELSAFCPNPRKAVVVPLESPGGRIFVGLARDNAETLITALKLIAEDRRHGASAAE
jgi:hypothetical protein